MFGGCLHSHVTDCWQQRMIVISIFCALRSRPGGAVHGNLQVVPHNMMSLQQASASASGAMHQLPQRQCCVCVMP
jgi:hypothetical protein